MPSIVFPSFFHAFIVLSLFSGVDILKLVAAQVGTQWIDVYQSLANATEREVAAFSNSYSSDHERAYAALQHWTIRDSDANLAKLINALHRQRRIDVVEKIRCVMEDNPQVGWTEATEHPDFNLEIVVTIFFHFCHNCGSVSANMRS